MMRRISRLAAATVLTLACAGTARAGTLDQAAGAFTVPDAGEEAFAQPAPALPKDAWEDFREGRALFRQVWVIPPARDDLNVVGLGPVYNDTSCVGCHVRNGRGAAPASADQPMHGMLVRLSLPGAGPHGAPVPDPNYGDQLNDHAIPGVPPEGTARIAYDERVVAFADGASVTLRVPHLTIGDLRFGALGEGVMTSPRVAQPVFGDGLLEAVTEADIVTNAARQAVPGSPIHGHVNRVWNVAEGRVTVGRFGWKANQPSLAQQVAGAGNGDMGLTSPLFPTKNCAPAQTACLAAPRGPQPELSAARLSAIVTYLMGLGVPARRDAGTPAVQHGEALFAALGCVQCHTATWVTGPLPAFPAASGQTIHPYTDFLLHDMGPGLADGRPDYLAGPAEWRTPPLWGVGLAQRVNPAASFLHDGRARSLTEAILWHGGEAENAQAAFTRLPKVDRDDLLAFLNSL